MSVILPRSFLQSEACSYGMWIGIEMCMSSRHEWARQQGVQSASLQHVIQACPRGPCNNSWASGPVSGPQFNYFLSHASDIWQMWLLNADAPGMAASRLNLDIADIGWMAFTSKSGLLNLIHCCMVGPEKWGSADPIIYHWDVVDARTCEVSSRGNHFGWIGRYKLRQHVYHAVTHQVVSIFGQRIDVHDAETGEVTAAFDVDLQLPPAASQSSGAYMHVRDVQWSPSGKLLSVLLQNLQMRRICVHGTATGQCVHSVWLHVWYPKLSWSPTADILIVWDHGGHEPNQGSTLMDGIMLLDPAQKKTVQLAANAQPSGQDLPPMKGKLWADVLWSPCGRLLLAWGENGCCLVIDLATAQRIAAAEASLFNMRSKTMLVDSPSVVGRTEKVVEALVRCTDTGSSLVRINNDGAAWHVQSTALDCGTTWDETHRFCIAPNGRIIAGGPIFPCGTGPSMWYHDLNTSQKHIIGHEFASCVSDITWMPMPPAWPSIYAGHMLLQPYPMGLYGCKSMVQLWDARANKIEASWTLPELLMLAEAQGREKPAGASAHPGMLKWSYGGQHIAVVLGNEVLVMAFKAPV